MTLITTIADPSADSYVSVSEADSYFSNRKGFDTSDWENLELDEKEWRLRLGAMILDNMKFRGSKATKDQARAFPRIPQRSSLWRTEVSDAEIAFDTWADVVEYATDNSLTAPIIPAEVKSAQCEVTYQVVHKHMMDLEPMELGDVKTSFIGLGKLQVQIGSKFYDMSNDFVDKGTVSAISIVKFYLSRWLTNTKGWLI